MVWLVMACGESSTPPMDAGGSDLHPSPDAGDPTCPAPPGAHPSVGTGVPSPGWRCIRDPRFLTAPRDVAVAGGSIFVSEMGSGRIVAVGETVDVVAEGLAAPIGLRMLPDGDLLVAEEGAGSIARIDVASGERMEVLADLSAVTYLELGPDGAAYVSSFREVARTGTGVVWRVDLETTERTAYATGLHVPEGLFFEGDALRVVEWHLPSAVVGFPAGGGDEAMELGAGYENAYGLVSDREGGFIVGDHAGRIVRHRADGSTEVLLDGIGRPGGMAWAADGALLIAEFVDFGAPGHLIRLEPR